MTTKYNNRPLILGILFTFIIAAVSYSLALLPLISSVGALAVAIIISIMYRNTIGYPIQIKSGIQFSAKKLLRVAIILYGLKLNLYIIFSEGLTLLLFGTCVIIFSIGLMMLLNKYLKGNSNIAFLLGVGTGICGASAIAAVSSILDSDDEDTAISVGIIALVGTAFALIYSFLYPVLNMGDTVFGIWSGISLHEIAQVVLAAGVGGDETMAFALLAKLGRVFLLIPVSFIIFYFVQKNSQKSGGKQKIDIPYFLFGFLALAVLNTFVTIPENVLAVIDQIARFLMIMAMVGLGLNVSLQALLSKATKPLIAIVVTSLLLSVITFIITAAIY